ncbi:hypothetical protein TSAR_002435 [Trichomalopsis sarcophagae]|uniref:Uncharacterized protein n=1 Tax=Trichomalopsis sarcophagae TaxID=543379 RepID=A0A232EG64_9HYME|nr:hypothetical protein TSAR_002435 [Trichomalopsis sarcophagae]
MKRESEKDNDRKLGTEKFNNEIKEGLKMVEGKIKEEDGYLPPENDNAEGIAFEYQGCYNTVALFALINAEIKSCHAVEL